MLIHRCRNSAYVLFRLLFEDISSLNQVLLRNTLPSLVKCLGDVDTSIRTMASDCFVAFFPVFSCADLLKSQMFHMDNPRCRELLLHTISDAILKNGIKLVDALLNLEWMISTILAMCDDKLRFVRDEAMKLLELLYSFEPELLTSAVEKSNLRRSTIEEIFSLFENPDLRNPESFAQEITPLQYESKNEFTKSMKHLIQNFQSKPDKSNWSEKVDILCKLQAIIKGNSFKKFSISIISTLKPLWVPLQYVLNEYRPALIKEATQLLALLSIETKEQFCNVADILLEDLMKHHGSSKVNSEACDHCIQIWMANSLPSNLLSQITKCLKEKNSHIRLKCTEYLIKLLDGNFTLYLDKHIDLVDKSIRKYLVDSDSNVRSNARHAFVRFREGWPSKASKLYDSLDSSTKNTIMKDSEVKNPPPKRALEPLRRIDIEKQEKAANRQLKRSLSSMSLKSKTHDKLVRTKDDISIIKSSKTLKQSRPNENIKFLSKKPSGSQKEAITFAKIKAKGSFSQNENENVDIKKKMKLKNSTNNVGMTSNNMSYSTSHIAHISESSKSKKLKKSIVSVHDLISGIFMDPRCILKLSSILEQIEPDEIFDLLTQEELFSYLNSAISSSPNPMVRMKSRDCIVTIMLKLGDLFNPYFSQMDSVYQKLVENSYKVKVTGS